MRVRQRLESRLCAGCCRLEADGPRWALAHRRDRPYRDAPTAPAGDRADLRDVPADLGPPLLAVRKGRDDLVSGRAAPPRPAPEPGLAAAADTRARRAPQADRGRRELRHVTRLGAQAGELELRLDLAGAGAGRRRELDLPAPARRRADR